ncbi:hypothetical protein ACWCXX_12495 [Streptomyces sp. NPDC001732]
MAAAAAVLITANPAAAASEPDETGLTFYTVDADQLTPVANFPDPDGECTAFPSTATLLVGWSDVTQVIAYKSADCTGGAWGLGTLRGFEAGEYLSFVAY